MYNPGTEKNTHCPPGYVQDIFGGECIANDICAMAERGTLRYSLFKGEMSGITEVMSAAVKALAANTNGSNKSCDEKLGRYGYPTTEECRPRCIIRNIPLTRDAPKPDTLFLWGRQFKEDFEIEEPENSVEIDGRLRRDTGDVPDKRDSRYIQRPLRNRRP